MVKVQRTFPAPSSLQVEAQKISGSYSEQDVIKQLKADFNNKCYICEMNNLQDPQVEHLLPHKNGKFLDKKFMWENLFWSCGHCNGVKNQRVYDENIIDCCKEDPEDKIYFRLMEGNVEIIPYNNDVDSKITAQLVYEVFNTKNTGMRVHKSSMRLKELEKEMNVLYDNIEKYKKNPKSNVIKRKIQVLLRREAAFAGFKRCYIREHIKDYSEFEEFIK